MAFDPDDPQNVPQRIAALTRAARTDGSEMSRPAREAFLRNFETEHTCKYCGTITINQAMPPEQRARAARAAMSAHFHRLATVSARARAAVEHAAEAEAELEQLDAAE